MIYSFDMVDQALIKYNELFVMHKEKTMAQGKELY